MKEFIEKLIGRLGKNRRPIVTNDEDLEWNRAVYSCTEIVNQLAEEYNNDFCEWKVKGNYYTTQCSNETGVIWDIEKSKYKFCPYCGKKIKVVE